MSYGQALDGTKWEMKTRAGSASMSLAEATFHNDTIFIDDLAGTYVAFAVYETIDSLFSIADFNAASACSPLDTGYYLWEVSNDTLKFTLVQDSLCNLRVSNLTSLDWVQTNVGLGDQRKETFSFYPNPSAGNIRLQIPSSFIGERLRVYSLGGQELKSQLMQQNKQDLSLEDVAPGLYCLTLGHGAPVKLILD